MREKDEAITIYYANVASAVVEGIKKGNFGVTIEGVIKANVLFNLITVSQEFKASQTYP